MANEIFRYMSLLALFILFEYVIRIFIECVIEDQDNSPNNVSNHFVYLFIYSLFFYQHQQNIGKENSYILVSLFFLLVVFTLFLSN